MHGHAFDDQDRWHDYSPTAPTRQRPYYSTPCPAGDVQSVRIVQNPCMPHWTPNYWRRSPVIRPPARLTILVEELPKSMLRQSPNQQIPFYPTPGLNALFKGLLLTDAKRHMCQVLCAHCAMHTLHKQMMLERMQFVSQKQLQFRTENSWLPMKTVWCWEKSSETIFFVKTVVTRNWTGDFFWKHCNVQKEFEFRATLVTIHIICKNTICKNQLTIEVNWFLRRRKKHCDFQDRFVFWAPL